MLLLPTDMPTLNVMDGINAKMMKHKTYGCVRWLTALVNTFMTELV